MKAKSRRRLLISSVAMLLVAMLALGTATFAWFTSNTQATANGINVRTTKTSTLKISDNSRDYTTSFSYNDAESEFKPAAIMFPASSANGTAWFNTQAANTDEFNPLTTATPTNVSNDAKYVFKNQLNIQNAGDIAVDNITITISGLSSTYGKVAVVPVAAKAGQGTAVANIPNGTSFADYVYADAATAYKPITASGALPGTSDASITPIAATSGSAVIDSTKVSALSSLAGNGELHFNVYVWFEGQDPECKDANAGLQALSNVQFTVEGTPHFEG